VKVKIVPSKNCAPTFGSVFDARNNAFCLSRLVLAILVIYSHCYPLGGFGQDPLCLVSSGCMTIGTLCVQLFFTLSGFLITRSRVSATSLSRFLWHRCLRIFPGYWVCLLVTVLLFLPCLSWVETGDALRAYHFRVSTAITYLPANFFLWANQPTIGVILAHHPFSEAINGSLWSLPYEGFCYLVIGALGTLGLLTRRVGLILSLFGMLWISHAAITLFPAMVGTGRLWTIAGLSIGSSLYFLAGSVLYLYRNHVPCDGRLFVLSLLLIVLGLLCGPWFALIGPITAPYAILWLVSRLRLSRLEAYGDFSYGVYVYAFPVQQLLAAPGFHRFSLTGYFLASTILTLGLAVLSHRFIEAPCLKLKNIDFARFFSKPVANPRQVSSQAGTWEVEKTLVAHGN
jgi:peptidoglycan/LPS O-acetylase OafA/YrhL